MKKKQYEFLATVLTIQDGWQENVYHPSKEDIPENWKEIRNTIIARDLKCYRCGKRRIRDLTVHHLIPRSEGGGDNSENLITLCNQCHDIVEMAACRSLADIDATIEEPSPKPKREAEKIPDREETFDRPEWHKWVYGGVKKPT